MYRYKHDECSLCGVTFKVGRLRTATEPRTASWTLHDKEHMGNTFYPNNVLAFAGGCGEYSGCMLAFRYEPTKQCCSPEIRLTRRQDMSVPGESGAGEKSDAVLSEEYPPENKMSEYIKVVYGSSQPERFLYVGDWKFWGKSDVRAILQARLEKEGFVFEQEDWVSGCIFEHISGRHCRIAKFMISHGYNGHNISFSEVETCHVAQCIVLRDPTSPPRVLMPQARQNSATDQEDQSRDQNDSEWCESDLSFGHTNWAPVTYNLTLHGRYLLPANDPRLFKPFVYYMPFHPACLEVFKRAALWKHGRFDIDNLGKWFLATKRFMRRFERHQAVEKAMFERHYAWTHHIGSEWLVANPCSVPVLDEMMNDLKRTSTKGISSDQVSDEVHDKGCEWDYHAMINLQLTTTEITSLPTELYLQIFDQMHIADVAATEVAFPKLRSFTGSYLRCRFDREYPYLWEFWCTRPYTRSITKQMAKVSYETMMEALKRWTVNPTIDFESTKQMVNSIQQEIIEKHGHMPEPVYSDVLNDSADIDLARFVVELNNAFKRKEAKGLVNRRRIWKNCERILDQIDLLEKRTNGDWNVRDLQARGRWTLADSQYLETLLYGDATPR